MHRPFYCFIGHNTELINDISMVSSQRTRRGRLVDADFSSSAGIAARAGKGEFSHGWTPTRILFQRVRKFGVARPVNPTRG